MAVSNRSLCTRPFMDQVRRICCFHPAALVLREKDMDEADYESMAREVLKLCASYQVPCILHILYRRPPTIWVLMESICRCGN